MAPGIELNRSMSVSDSISDSTASDGRNCYPPSLNNYAVVARHNERKISGFWPLARFSAVFSACTGHSVSVVTYRACGENGQARAKSATCLLLLRLRADQGQFPFFGTSSLIFNILLTILLAALLVAGDNWRLLAFAFWASAPVLS